MAERERSPQDREWYERGLRFSCTQCGNCCTGPPGAVWFTAEEGRRIAETLGIDEVTFYRRYARRIHGRWSLEEVKSDDGLDCIFLDRLTAPGKARCSIYPVRPTQCRTWPFWPENLESRAAWDEAKRNTPCPGMDRGSLIPIEAIRVRRDATNDDHDDR